MLSPSSVSLNDLSEEGTDLSSTVSEQWNVEPQITPSIPLPDPDAGQNGRVDITATDLVQSVGLSDPVLSSIRRKKLDAVNRLHSLGTQQDIDLPTIVVIGSQSAGKSSLIESISGINLPRSNGTCTRCPTECRLISTPGEQWQCVVSLRFLKDQNGVPLDAVQNITFGNTIRNPQEVEERLRRAQLAILNPSIPFRTFLKGDGQFTKSMLNFSNNIVCLEIKGPNVTDLSFCDLPGLIASVADGGRDEDVDEVRELVASYIQKDSCIILLTVTCEVDFETQGAYRLARKYDPEGVRTIGVLTKPDRIPEGDLDHARWLGLIRNESSPLKNGWFCVKQLSSVQLGKRYTFEESRRICDSFFKENYPWKSLDSFCQKRLGTTAVTVKLNEFLMSMITKRIPEILQELEEFIQNTKNKLRELPIPPSADPFLEVMHLINHFCDTLYNHCKGFNLADEDNSEECVGNQFEDIREVQGEFRRAIEETGLKFRPFVRSREYELGNYIYLDDVSKMATRAVTRELPGFFPFRVVQELIARSTDRWKVPAIDFINGIFTVVCQHQARLINSHFGKYTSGLHHTIQNLVNGYMQTRKEMLENQIKSLLKFESSAFTLNDTLFLQCKKDSLEEHERVHRNYPDYVHDSDSALNIMATVEAYFQVASKRFVDNVPLAVDHDLVRIEKRALEEVLCKGLKLTDPRAFESCARFLVESTEISDLRKELKKRLKRLTAAQAELLDI